MAIENFVFYVAAAFFGWSVARGVRSGLSHSPLSKTHSEAITTGLIWVLSTFYLIRLVRGPLQSITIERDIKLWMLTVGVPWAVCALGLPMVLPRIWTAILASLRDGAIQWLLTIVAAILSYGVFTISQLYTDLLIQSVVQTHPNQFPGAQRVLTFIVATCGWILVVYFVTFLALMFSPVVEKIYGNHLITNAARVTSVLFALFVIPMTVLITLQNAYTAFEHVTPIDEHGRHARPGSFGEYLLLGTSFIPNRVVEGVQRSEAGEFVQQTRLACRNLLPDVYVAFVHPDEVVPDKAIVAEPRSGESARGRAVQRCWIG